MSDKPVITTEAGAPIADNQNSLIAGPRGPLLVQDYQLFEKHARRLNISMSQPEAAE